MSKFFETFTPPSESGREKPRSYDIKPLSKMDFWRFCTNGIATGDRAIEIEKGVLISCLTGWTNITKNGEPVEFESNIDHIIEHVPVAHMRLLVNRITNLSHLADDELKN